MVSLLGGVSGKHANLEADYNRMRASSEEVQLVIHLEEFVAQLIDENPFAKDLEECQRKVDAQKMIVKVFHETFGGGQSAAAERLNMTLVDKPRHMQRRGRSCGCGTVVRISCSSAA